MTTDPRRTPPIAIVGLGAIMPGAPDVDTFWRNVIEGRDLITDVPADRWLIEDYYDPDPEAPDKTYCTRGGFLPDIAFDPLRYGLPPKNLSSTDSSQLLALTVADRVLSDAGRGEGRIDHERVSVVLGSGMLKLGGELGARMNRPVLRKVLRERGIAEDEVRAICDAVAGHSVGFQEASLPGVLANVVAGRIANTFDLHGANCTVDAACASSLAAISASIDELAMGRADLVITGGVDTLNDPFMFVSFSKTPALSPTGDCRPFSVDADGIVLGEGLAMFALKRLSDAEREGDQIYAVITGVGSSSDGRGTSIYSPLASGQERALRRAYASAGYGPETVGLIEAHGTGTAAGDKAEVAALRAVFGEAAPGARQWCALGSVKSQIGHTKTAAGAAGVLKAALALHHRVLPPTIKIGEPDPALGLDSGPFYLNTVARPWVHGVEHPRRASVSSFGFGGTNYHVTLEEYVPGKSSGAQAIRGPRSLSRPTELLLVSADSPKELLARCSRLAEELDRPPSADSLLRAQQQFRAVDTVRLAMCAGPGELADRLDEAMRQIRAQPDSDFSTPAGTHYAVGRHDYGRIAFLFPGQGSQYPGMGADVAMHLPVAQEVWDRLAGPELAAVVFPRPVFGDAERAGQRMRLAATESAQPALAATSLALLAVLETFGIRPDCVGGHSLGELTALHAAGAFDAESLLRLAFRRGELMRDADSDGGAMLAVGMAYADVARLIEERGVHDLWIANDNGPTQVVLAGSTEAVAKFEIELGGEVPTTRMATLGAFHSPRMASVAAPMRDFVRHMRIRAPLLDVYRNVDGACAPIEPDLIRRSLVDHVTDRVRFTTMISTMYDDGVRTFIEVGPGSVLTGLVGAILTERPHHRIAVDRKDRNGITSLFSALAQLAALGVPITCDALWDGHRPSRPREPGMGVAINGGNYGRPYPPPDDTVGLPVPNPTDRGSRSAGTIRPLPGPIRTARFTADQGMVESLLEVQRQTAQAHAAYLATAEKALAALMGTAASPDAVLRSSETALVDSPVASEFEPESELAVRSSETARADPPVAPELGPESELAVRDPAAAEDMTALVLSVIADKTGYPVDMLAPHMELEADLGLDSITRAQIGVALRSRFPTLERRAESIDLGAVQTVDDIATALRDLTAPKTAALTAGPPLRRWQTVAVPAQAGGAPMAGLESGVLIITDDGHGVAAHLAAALAERGVAARVSETVPADAAGVVFLGGLADVSTVDEALVVARRAFDTARAFAGSGRVFVTVQDTGGSFGPCVTDPVRAWLGGIAAVARTAAAEWPSVRVKAIDCERRGRDAVATAQAIATELLCGGADLDVGLDGDGTRRILDLTEIRGLPPEDAEIGPNDVVVVSGGARGVTATAIHELARTYRPKFVLIGRTRLDVEPALAEIHTEEDLLRALGGPGIALTEARARAREVLAAREIRANLAALDEAGSLARYVEMDVRDRAGVTSALDGIRAEWGPITGVVHGAGILAGEQITDKSDAQFDLCFGTKVTGLRVLLEATRADPLRLLCAFSSVAGRFGYAGQCDYAMGNETLDHVLATEQAARPDCLVRSIQWGPWQRGMVTPLLKESLLAAGIDLIEPAVGASAFVAELGYAATDPRVLVAADPAILGLRSAAEAIPR
ncbi:SDR family NAD(P)-dependent oxidoreductase [Nocardia sp. NPDC051570]|uniref:SDR family NAD(P)-dependent oxidoreductase n=1 Tax=Nocardia sp. NPDC051570 TaxID=3364324 RepID=UPI00379893D2